MEKKEEVERIVHHKNSLHSQKWYAYTIRTKQKKKKYSKFCKSIDTEA